MLEFQGVCAGYGGEEVLHEVNAAFSKGGVSAVIGPNGCGKSTLLKTADGLLRPSRGAVLLDGVPLPALKPRALARRVAYLPQSRAAGSITARQLVLHGRFPYLGYPRRYRTADLEAAERAMEWAGVVRLSGRRLNELSGGERQKVYLAMALAQETDYILLDEPTTYLDISHQLELMELARRLGEMGKAVVMVLHDLNLALRWCGRAVLLENGRIADAGTPEELCQRGSIERVFHVRMGSCLVPEMGRQYFFCDQNMQS